MRKYPHKLGNSDYIEGMSDFMYDRIITKGFSTILELGTRRGESLTIFSNALIDAKRKGTVYSMDKDLTLAEPPHDNCVLVRSDTRDCTWDKPLDMLFIDADHAYESVRRDIIKFGPWVKKGGEVWLHDVTSMPFGKDIWAAAIEWMRGTYLAEGTLVTVFVTRTGLAVIPVGRDLKESIGCAEDRFPDNAALKSWGKRPEADWIEADARG